MQLTFIDGFNGLLIGFSIMSLVIFGNVCFQVGDLTLLSTIVIFAGTLMGLFFLIFQRDIFLLVMVELI